MASSLHKILYECEILQGIYFIFWKVPISTLQQIFLLSVKGNTSYVQQCYSSVVLYYARIAIKLRNAYCATEFRQNRINPAKWQKRHRERRDP